MLAENQFWVKSQLGVCVNCLLLIVSAILRFQVFYALPCLFLQSLVGNYDVNAWLGTALTQQRILLVFFLLRYEAAILILSY